MAQNIIHDQIKGAILEQLSQKKSLHQRDIKSTIDQVKNKYIWDTKIGLEELGRIITHFKNNWQDFKDQTKMIRRETFVGFRRYQV